MDILDSKADLAPKRPHRWRYAAALLVAWAALSAVYVLVEGPLLTPRAVDDAPARWLPVVLLLGTVAVVVAVLARVVLRGEHLRLSLTAELHRRRAQLELQRRLLESEGRYRLAVEHAPEALLLLDARGHVHAASAAAHAFFGVRDGALHGRSFIALFPEDVREALALRLAPGAELAVPVEAEIAVEHRPRAAIEVAVRPYPLGDDRLAVVAVRDVSRWRERQRALEHSHDEALERERTKNDLVATLSHEIRTPLNGILGMVRLLEEEELPTEPRELVRHIHGSARALVDTLEDVLQASKLSAGGLVIEQQPFDLLELVEEVVVLHHEAADRRGLRLVVASTSELQRQVVGDAQRLRQVLSNLVNNAVKFTHTGHVRLALSTRSIAVRTLELRIDVEDTGVGIPADKLEKVFERFARLDAEASRIEGTGLGLAIAREVARLMGGDVTASSPLGGGTCFTFTAQLHTAAEPAGRASEGSVAGTRVLVALPARVERDAVTSFLTSHGAICVGASSSLQVREHLDAAQSQGRPFAVILGDKALSDAEPWAFTNLGADEPGPHLVLIARLSDRVRADQAAALGAWRILRRPILPSRLLRLLARAIGAAPTPQTSPGTRPGRAPGGPITDTPPFIGRRILVVEDNPTNQKVAEIMVRKLGCDVTIANDGREALTRVREGHFDLVFMDCQMPELDGYEATREIRSWGGPYGVLPIIALTAHANSGDRERSLAAGMNDHLTKPVTREGFRETLSRWLSPAPEAPPSA